MEWSTESIEKIICFVQERPFLFDVSSAELAWTCTKIWCKKLAQETCASFLHNFLDCVPPPLVEQIITSGLFHPDHGWLHARQRRRHVRQRYVPLVSEHPKQTNKQRKHAKDTQTRATKYKSPAVARVSRPYSWCTCATCIHNFRPSTTYRSI